MTEENLTTDDESTQGAAEDSLNDDSNLDTEGDSQDDEKPFTEAQMNVLGPMMGRIIKRQLEDSVIPHLQGLQNNNDDREDDDLSLGYIENPEAVINKVLDKRIAAQAKASQQKIIALDQELVKFSDNPLYKDIYPEMKKIATEASTKEGYPAQAAAKLAFQTAKANYLDRQTKGEEHPNLGMTSGGKQVRRSKQGTLKEEYKEAAKRDIAKGYFKDEADWIDSMSPEIRARAFK